VNLVGAPYKSLDFLETGIGMFIKPEQLVTPGEAARESRDDAKAMAMLPLSGSKTCQQSVGAATSAANPGPI
jgi:hypothetical protein